jgi:hypothetical protein
MPLSTRLFPPLSLKEILEELGSFSDQQFELFLSETLTPAAFDSSQERCEAVARKIDKDPGLLGYIFGALGLLYREVRRKAKDRKTLKALIEELLSTFDIASAGKTDVNVLTDRLVKLLSYNESAERRDKIGRLKKGFIPNAMGFSSFVDLRPNYDSERTKVSEFVPLVQFRIRTDSDDEREQFLVFQLDEPALDRLGEALKDVQKKLEVIKRDAVISGRIVQ